MQVSRCLKLLSTSALLLIVAGCATPYKGVTDLSPDSLQSGKSVTMVYALDCATRSTMSGRCTEDSELKSGGDFVTDPPRVSGAARAIGKHEALQAATASLDVNKVMRASLAKHFKPLFEASGLNATMGNVDVRTWALPQRSKHTFINFSAYHRDSLKNDEARTGSAISFNPDYQSFIEGLNTDYLLVIELLRYGIVRKYTPGISVALELPTAAAAIRATLYQDNIAEPIYDNIISRRSVPDFEWKTPPEFVELMALPPRVLDAVIQDAANEFFSR